MQKRNAIPEFRYNKRRKHYAYIFKSKGDFCENLLLSSKPERKINRKGKIKRIKNVPLYKHPNPNKNEQSYIMKQVYSDHNADFYSRRLSNWKFHDYDRRKIKKIIHKKWK